MSWIYVIVLLCCTYECESNQDAISSTTIKTTTTSKPKITEEDLRIVNETIAKYGPVHDFREMGLPGPEIVKRVKAGDFENIFKFDEKSGNYTLKLRGLTPLFAYTRRYEVGTKAEIGDDPIVKGQFTEHFLRHDATYYIRTIGYILDEEGYRQFLLDVSKAESLPSNKRISSAALASLTGGGLG